MAEATGTSPGGQTSLPPSSCPRGRLGPIRPLFTCPWTPCSTPGPPSAYLARGVSPGVRRDPPGDHGLTRELAMQLDCQLGSQVGDCQPWQVMASSEPALDGSRVLLLTPSLGTSRVSCISKQHGRGRSGSGKRQALAWNCSFGGLAHVGWALQIPAMASHKVIICQSGASHVPLSTCAVGPHLALLKIHALGTSCQSRHISPHANAASSCPSLVVPA